MKKSTKRNIILLALSLIVLFFVIRCFSNRIPDTAVSYTGTISAIGDQQITVEYEGDYIANITILSTTKICNSKGSSIDFSELALKSEIIFIADPTVIYEEPERFPTCYKIMVQ